MPLRTTTRTGDQALVREINLSLIMNHLLGNSSLSRASLAEVTGLNKSTVSSLVQELIVNDKVNIIAGFGLTPLAFRKQLHQG